MDSKSEAELEGDLFHDFGGVRILPVFIPTAVNSFRGQTNTGVGNVPPYTLSITWLFLTLLMGKKQIWQLIKLNTA